MKAVVFDLDGTLVHSAPDMAIAINAVLARYDLGPLSAEKAQRFVGDGARKLVERAFARYDRAPDSVEKAVTQFQHEYAKTGHTLTQPYPGAVEALDRLRARGVALAICTNKDEGPARTLLDVLGLTDRFAAIIGGDTVGVRKPDPKPLFAAAAGCGAAVDEIVYVGDGETDRATARAAGAAFALHTQGYRKSAVDELAPHAAFDAYADLDVALARAQSAAGRAAA
ncbi:MAG: phosphoglycolate phosphatase [Pseudomonadota bacterium]